MSHHVSAQVRNVIWRIMTDKDFRKKVEALGALPACKEAGIELSEDEATAVAKVDLADLDGLLQTLERDMSLVMGGSRPRRAIALSDAAISELRDALDKARRLEE